MNPLSAPVRIAIFILAVICTAGLAYAAFKTIKWAYEYVGSVGNGGPPILRVIGVALIALVIGLRFYVRRRAKAAQANKGD